jgi:catechol 2,3-dioxygenase-like lactoylglutathione lyase family enzyme
MIVGIDHAEISVNDFETTVNFYKKLGFKQKSVFEQDGRIVQIQMSSGNVNLDLVKAPEGEKPKLEHLAFLVDDMDQTVIELKQIGATIVLEPITSERSGRKLAAFKDIDGILHQLAKPQ